MIDASGPVGFDGFAAVAMGTGVDNGGSIFGMSILIAGGLAFGAGVPTDTTSAMFDSLRTRAIGGSGVTNGEGIGSSGCSGVGTTAR